MRLSNAGRVKEEAVMQEVASVHSHLIIDHKYLMHITLSTCMHPVIPCNKHHEIELEKNIKGIKYCSVVPTLSIYFFGIPSLLNVIVA